MRFACKVGLVPALLAVGVLIPFPARAQTLAARAGAPWGGAVSASPALPGYQEAVWPDFLSLDAGTFFRPGGQPTGRALGMNPILPRNDPSSPVFGVSPLFILDFTHSAYAWSPPAWNEDIRLWINGLGGGMPWMPKAGVLTFGSDTPPYALYADSGLGWFPGDGLQPNWR